MKKYRKRIRAIIVFSLVLSIFLVLAVSVYGASSITVKPSGKKDNTDIKRISKALKKYKTIKLKKGKKYYLQTPIHIKSNRTIIATGATIVAKGDIIVTDLKKANYQNVKNVTITGGVWKSKTKKGYKGTSIRFVHSSGINLSNMTIKHTNYNGHAVELVGCSDVVMDSVKVIPRGTPKKGHEAMVQIDIATDATYPRIKGTALSNGAICNNIVIRNCSIKGNRAIGTGYDYKKQGFMDNAHTDIQILNNNLVSTNAEALLLINTKNALVQDNNIESNFGNLSADKATGLHFLVIGNIPDTELQCYNNTIKGGKYAIRVYSQGSQMVGSALLANNSCYCKRGAGAAIQAAEKGIRSLRLSENATYKW